MDEAKFEATLFLVLSVGLSLARSLECRIDPVKRFKLLSYFQLESLSSLVVLPLHCL